MKAVDASHADPTKDARGCYKAGDPVVVMPDGHPWGAAEGLPTFWIVKVTGMTVDEGRAFLAASPLVRRTHRLDTASIPGAILAILNATGVVTVTRTQALAALKVKG